MARFANTASTDLSFDLGGRRYDVPPGGEVTIPDRVAYAVKGRGLPLVPVEGAADEPPAREEAETLETWKTRALDQRERAEYFQGERDALRADLSNALAERDAHASALDAHRTGTDAFAVELRKRLGIGDTASILEAIDALRGELATVTAERDELLAAPPPAGAESPVPGSPEAGVAPAEGPKAPARRPR